MMLIIIYILMEACGWIKGIEGFSKGCSAASSSPGTQPHIHWRYSPGDVLHLEVYYSQHMHNFSTLKPNQIVSNPSCYVENGPLDENKTIQVEFVNFTTWCSEKIEKNTQFSETQNFYFNIQQALFRIEKEAVGSIVCELFSSELPTIRKSLNIRKIINDPIVFLTAVYEPNLCNNDSCTKEVWKTASSNLTKELSTRSRKLRIEPMLHNYLNNGSSQQVIFRVRERNRGESLSAATIDGNLTLSLDIDFLKHLTDRVNNVSLLRPRVEELRSGRACVGDAPWPLTRAGLWAFRGSLGACEQSRHCVDDPLGAHWEPLSDSVKMHKKKPKCNESHHTQMLEDLSKKTRILVDGVGTDAIQNIEMILKNMTDSSLSERNIQSIAEVLQNVQEDTELSSKSVASVTNVINMLLLLDGKQNNNGTLQRTQQKAATSNILLQSLDNILSKAPLISTKELIIKEKLTIFITDIDKNNKTTIPGGLAVMNQEDIFNPTQINLLPHNTSLEWLLEQDITAAVKLPESILYNLDNGLHRLALTIFLDSKLFGGEASQATSGHILGITINGKHIPLQDPILLLFKKSRMASKTNIKSEDDNKCVFWDFDADNGKGEWSQAGCTLAKNHGNKTDICVCTHLTHFGKLLYNTGSVYEEYYSSPTLNTITIIGCSLSLAGLAGVFLSAFLFPERSTGRWLQLQLCFAQALLMIAFLWDAASHTNGILCLLRGLLLHWSLLALGIWTLVAALYQHRRLTQPLHALKTDPRFLPIASTLSWGLPTVICLLLTFLSTKAYVPPTCYPFDIELLLTVIIPIGCIVIANSIIFSLIIWSICYCSPNSPQLRESQNHSTRTLRKIVASAYLFILLGLCWLFGFLQWQYLFSITASLQGVSHFVFCVILDRATRRSWKLYKKRQQLQISSIKSWTRTSLLQKSH